MPQHLDVLGQQHSRWTLRYFFQIFFSLCILLAWVYPFYHPLPRHYLRLSSVIYKLSNAITSAHLCWFHSSSDTWLLLRKSLPLKLSQVAKLFIHTSLFFRVENVSLFPSLASSNFLLICPHIKTTVPLGLRSSNYITPYPSSLTFPVNAIMPFFTQDMSCHY